jgi:hypothetical protein
MIKTILHQQYLSLKMCASLHMLNAIYKTVEYY